MKPDRVLLAILAGIFVLVLLSVVLFFVRGGELEYSSATDPADVVRNYVLALHKEDYQRAYGYLHEEDLMPTLTEFRQNFIGRTWELENAGLQLGSEAIEGDEATVRLTIIHGGTDPFDSAWNESNTAWLKQQGDSWKLTYMPSPYWGWDWYQDTD